MTGRTLHLEDAAEEDDADGSELVQGEPPSPCNFASQASPTPGHWKPNTMKKVQEASQIIPNAVREVGIHVNPKKIDAVLLSFQKGKRGTLSKTFTIDEQEQPVSPGIKYLEIQSDLWITSHVRNQFNTAREIAAQPSAAVEL